MDEDRLKQGWRKKCQNIEADDRLSVRFIEMLFDLESIWGGHLGGASFAEHQVKSYSAEANPIHFEPYRAGPKTQAFEENWIYKVTGQDVLVPAQTERALPMVIAP